MNIRKEVKKIFPSTYGYVEGYFGWPTRWDKCRENFHGYCHTNSFFYCCNNFRRVASFIYLLESHLNINPKSVFYPTDSPKVVCIEPDSWWRDQMMRYQFFTIALRAASRWDGMGDWKYWMYENQYTKTNKDAVTAFLDGRTRYTGNITGWVAQFTFSGAPAYSVSNPVTKEKLNTLLVYPKYSPEERRRLIEKLAYYKWEQAGRPIGEDMKFWQAGLNEYRAHHMA